MLKNISTTSAAALAATLAGLVREGALAYLFGTTPYADGFATAVFLHDTVAAAFVFGGFGFAAVPLITRQRLEHGDGSAMQLVAGTTAWIALASLGLALLVWPLVPAAVRLAMHDGARERATVMSAVLQGALPALALMTVASTLAGFLPGFGRFARPSVGRLVWNAGIVAGLLLFRRAPATTEVVAALCLGALANLATVALGFPRASGGGKVSLRHTRLAELWRVAAPSLLAVSGATLLLGLWERYLLARLGVGSIAVVNYAQRASYMASTVSTAVGVVAFTELASHAQGGTLAPAGVTTLATVTRRYLLLLIPTMGFMLVARGDIIALLFARGAFDHSAIVRTTAAFGVYTWSVLPVFVTGIFTRTLFAIERPWLALRLLVVGALVSAVLDWVLVSRVGEVAIPAGYAAGTLVAAAAGVMFVGFRVGPSVPQTVFLAVGLGALLGGAGALGHSLALGALGRWHLCPDPVEGGARCEAARLIIGFPVFAISAALAAFVLGIEDMRQGGAWLRARLLPNPRS